MKLSTDEAGMARVALIAGCDGAAAAICARLAKLGYRVVIVCHPEVCNDSKMAAVKEVGHIVGAYACETTNQTSSRRCAEQIEQDAGAVDIFVNVIGEAAANDRVYANTDVNRMGEITQSDVDGAFALTKLLCERMVERGWGRIVHIASIDARDASVAEINRAVEARSKALASDVAHAAVTVNMISPSHIDAAMVVHEERKAEEGGVHSATSRIGQAEEVAGLVAYLVSEEAASITGANMIITGSQRKSSG